MLVVVAGGLGELAGVGDAFRVEVEVEAVGRAEVGLARNRGVGILVFQFGEVFLDVVVGVAEGHALRHEREGGVGGKNPAVEGGAEAVGVDGEARHAAGNSRIRAG